MYYLILHQSFYLIKQKNQSGLTQNDRKIRKKATKERERKGKRLIKEVK